MKLLITGVSHKTAPVEVRECLAFREDTLPAALADLRSRDGVAEAVILSTCNRVEITVTTDDSADPQAVIDSFLADHKSINPASIAPHLYRHQGREAQLATDPDRCREHVQEQPQGVPRRGDHARSPASPRVARPAKPPRRWRWG